MSKPKVYDVKPIKVRLEQEHGYWWCSCGKSENLPFCDGSHKGTEFLPLSFKAEETGDAYLCQCKHTGRPPYCDGYHHNVDKE